jgi:hypothetical protein
MRTQSALGKEEQVVEAGRLLDRKHAVTSAARAIGGRLVSGSAVISATGARLARLTRNLAGHQDAGPAELRDAVDRALAAKIARRPGPRPVSSGDAWQEAVLRIPRPRTATA